MRDKETKTHPFVTQIASSAVCQRRCPSLRRVMPLLSFF
jgi:hypothetical protein